MCVALNLHSCSEFEQPSAMAYNGYPKQSPQVLMLTESKPSHTPSIQKPQG